MPNNKKNKRGDRGSLEETPKDVKRPNLDATEESQSTEQLQDEDNVANELKEPSKGHATRPTKVSCSNFKRK